MFAPRGWLSRRFHRQMYRSVARSGLFDRSYYRHHNLRGALRFQDPLWHFLSTGWKQGSSPSAHFDSEYYVAKNDDVRVAGLNPLFHYVEYGHAERRLPVRSSLEAQHAATPEASPLRCFITPSLGHKRVSVLLDSATDLATPGNLLTIVRRAAEKAESESATLRVLIRTGSLNHLEVHEALSQLSQGIQDSAEITEVPSSLTYSDIPVFHDEISIATSWSTSFALRYSTEQENALAIGDLGQESSLIANDEKLRQLLSHRRTSAPETLPLELVVNLQKKGPSAKPGVFAFIDIEAHPMAYSLLVEALSHFLLNRLPDSDLPAVTLVGNPGPRFAIAEELHPTLLTTEEFAASNVSVTCALVLSRIEDPGPSALSMAGFRVIHATPQDSGLGIGETAGKDAFMRTALTAEALEKALSEVFS